jgi:hypothetical protein
MSVILIFVVFVVVGDIIALGISSLVERLSETASLFVFLALFIGVFIVAWCSALHITERYILRQR